MGGCPRGLGGDCCRGGGGRYQRGVGCHRRGAAAATEGGRRAAAAGGAAAIGGGGSASAGGGGGLLLREGRLVLGTAAPVAVPPVLAAARPLASSVPARRSHPPGARLRAMGQARPRRAAASGGALPSAPRPLSKTVWPESAKATTKERFLETRRPVPAYCSSNVPRSGSQLYAPLWAVTPRSGPTARHEDGHPSRPRGRTKPPNHTCRSRSRATVLAVTRP